VVSKTTGRRFEPCTARQEHCLVQCSFTFALLVVWWICRQVAANVPFLPSESLIKAKRGPLIQSWAYLCYFADVNARAQAKHQQKATLHALRVEADRARDAAFKQDRLDYQEFEQAVLGENKFKVSFQERLDAEKKLVGKRAVVRADHLRRTAKKKNLLQYVALVARVALERFQFIMRLVRPETSSIEVVRPAPLEQHPTASPNSPNTSN
jgi:hypothetical protein